MSEGKTPIDNEKFLAGGFSQMFLSVISGYICFTFFNPKLFEVIGAIDKKPDSQELIFLAFNIFYLWIPLLIFLIIASLNKNVWTGLVSWKGKKYNTLSIIKPFTWVMLPIICIPFIVIQFNSFNETELFYKLKKLNDQVKVIQKSDSIHHSTQKYLYSGKAKFVAKSTINSLPKDSSDFNGRIKDLSFVKHKNQYIPTIVDITDASNLALTYKTSFASNLKVDRYLRNMIKTLKVDLVGAPKKNAEKIRKAI